MRILVCGAGAIGSNLAALLAVDLRGDHEITVLDFDNVEERNIRAGTQFYTRDQIGQIKVEALQFNIFRNFERNINILNEELTEKNDAILAGYDLILDCFDNHKARSIVDLVWTAKPNSEGVNILHIGFSDQFTYSIEWAENYQIPDDGEMTIDICEMLGAASFVKMVASLASLTIQEFIRDGKKKEFVGNKFSLREII